MPFTALLKLNSPHNRWSKSVFLLMLLIAGCTTDPNPTSPANSTADTAVTISVETETDTATCSHQDSTLYTYIGWVNELELSEPKEYYVELYFRKNISSYQQFKDLVRLTEETVDKDGDNPRMLLSSQRAQKYLDLRGLDSLWLFDTHHHRLEKALPVKRYEYMNQDITSFFAAVYTAPQNANEMAYCIGGKLPAFSNLSVQETVNDTVIERIDQYFVEDEILTSFTHSHLQYTLNENTLLTLSNTNDHFFIHIQEPHQPIHLIYLPEEFTNLTRLQIIPILHSGLPVLLCEFVTPESDAMWTDVLIYDGQNYTLADRQRLSF